MSNEEVREQYIRYFQPRKYQKTMGVLTDVHPFFQKELHFIFNSPVSASWRTLLDVGSGPNVANCFPASRKIDSVVLSDLVPQNREEIEKWIHKAPDALDWSFMSEPLAALEGYKDVKAGARSIEERTRKAVKKVIPCDVLSPSILPDEHKEVFDVVLTGLCLAAASRDEQTFYRIVRNVSGLVRQGGHLIFCGLAGSYEYAVAGVKFPELPVTKTMVEDSLSRSGLQIRRWSSLDRATSPVPQKYWDFAFVAMAEKL